MYWIEVYYENGKTLRKETSNINESYNILARYLNGHGSPKPRVQLIKAGYNETTTGEWNKTEKVAF